MEQGERDGRRVEVVHLGDVYYTGWRLESEYRDRFLSIPGPCGPWLRRTRFGSWSLNGNHDMYAGGLRVLPDVPLADARFARQVTVAGAPTSEFLLQGDHWQILGLDSAWKLMGFNPDDLRGHAGYFGDGQVAWLDEVAGPRRTETLLLSHHQPFTRARRGSDGIDTVGNLLEQTAGVRGGDGVKA